MACANVFWILNGIIGTAMVGHISTESTYLTAQLLSSVVMNVFGMSIGFGMTGGLSTLGGQAFGAKRYHQVGIYLQRNAIIVLMVCVPVCTLWCFPSPLLRLSGQNQEVDELASKYMRIAAIGFPPAVLSELLASYLVLQSVVLIGIPLGLLGSTVNLGVTWLLVYYFELHLYGAAWAFAYSNWFGFLLQILACFKYGKLTWGGWSKEALTNWGPIGWLSLQSTALLCAEWWAFEVAAFAAGYVGPDRELSQAAYGLIFQMNSLLFMFSLGLSNAMETRVANFLGAGKSQDAQASFRAGVWMGLALSGTLAALLYLFRFEIGFALTKDARIVRHVGELMPIVCVLEVFDLFQGVLGGVLVGLGRQKVGSYAKVCAYWLLGGPLGVMLCFKAGWGIAGIVLGLAVGSFTVAAFLLVLILRTDWTVAAREAQANVAPESEFVSDDHNHNNNNNDSTHPRTDPALVDPCADVSASPSFRRTAHIVSGTGSLNSPSPNQSIQPAASSVSHAQVYNSHQSGRVGEIR